MLLQLFLVSFDWYDTEIDGTVGLMDPFILDLSALHLTSMTNFLQSKRNWNKINVYQSWLKSEEWSSLICYFQYYIDLWVTMSLNFSSESNKPILFLTLVNQLEICDLYWYINACSIATALMMLLCMVVWWHCNVTNWNQHQVWLGPLYNATCGHW